MSNTSLEEFIQDLELTQLSVFVATSARALWIYDYIQTLPIEIHAIWSQKMTGISFTFLVNRYLLLIAIIAQIYGDSPGNTSIASCTVWERFHYVCGIITVVTTSGLFTMRVYAMYGHSRWIVVVASVLVLGRLAVDIWDTTLLKQVDGSSLWDFRCNNGVTGNPETYNNLQLATDTLALAFDTFIVALTLRKTFFHVREMRRLSQTGIADILLRDGILYFLIVFLITVVDMSLHIITVVSPEQSLGTYSFTSIMSSYYDYMPNLLINRLVLNLRNYSTPLHRGVFTEPNDLPDMAFQSRSNRVLGNIGAPLDHGQWKDTFGWVESEESDGGSGEPEEPFDGTTAGETTGSSLLTGSADASEQRASVVIEMDDMVPPPQSPPNDLV